MALYYHLPVYQSSYLLVNRLFECTTHFVREYKYTVGQQLKDEGAMLIKNIYRANSADDKTTALREARENVEMIRLFLRIMQDFHQVSLKKFVELNLLIEDVSKQLTAWEKYCGAIRKPPESSVARAQTSVRSKSNNPLAKSEESCSPKGGHISSTHTKDDAITTEVIIALDGNLNNSTGVLTNQGSNGNYWSSSPNGGNAFNLNFNSGGVNPANNNNRANGFSVRCIQDLQKIWQLIRFKINSYS